MKPAYKLWVGFLLGIVATVIGTIVWPRPMKVTVYGIFDRDPFPAENNPSPPGLRAHLGIGVRPPEHGIPIPAADHVDGIDFYGSPGVKTADQLFTDTLKVGFLADGDSLTQPELFGAGTVSTWFDLPWDTSYTDYSLLLRVTCSAPGRPAHVHQAVRHFRGIASTTWKTMQAVHADPSGAGAGADHTQASATGSFYSGQSLAVYKLSVKYNTPPSGTVLNSITVSHGPRNGTMTVLGTISPQTMNQGTWTPTFYGRYNGGSEYELRIESSYALPTGPEAVVVHFYGIPSDSGHLMTGQ